MSEQLRGFLDEPEAWIFRAEHRDGRRFQAYVTYREARQLRKMYRSRGYKCEIVPKQLKKGRS